MTPVDEDLPLDERIDLLTRLCAAPPPDADRPELIGALAGALLDQYERDGDCDLLDAAIAGLGDALSVGPEHPDRLQWYYGLGLAYAERAVRRQAVDDFDRADEWFTRLRTALPDPDPDRDRVTVLLADVYWERSWLRRYGQPGDPAAAVAETRRLVAAIGALAVSHHCPDLASYRQLLLGLSHLACFDETGQRTDLDAGIDTLADALPRLPAEAERIGFACADLCYAYQERARQDGDRSSLDLAVSTGRRGLERVGPDEPEWELLHGYLALAYQRRWQDSEQAADLDLGIEHWQVVLAHDPGPAAAANCGYLRHQRALRHQDPVELAEAVRLLESAAATAGHDPDDAAVWFDLAQAYRSQWELAGTPGSLVAAERCLDRLLAIDLPDELQLPGHLERVLVAHNRVGHESRQSPAGPPPAVDRLGRCLVAAREVLDRTAGTAPDLRGSLAAMLAFGELYHGSFEFDQVDLDRVGRLLALARDHPDPPPGWSEFLDIGEGIVDHAVDAQRPARHGEGSVQALLRAADSEHLDQLSRQMAGQLVSMVGYSRASGFGDSRSASGALARLHHAGSAGPGGPDRTPDEAELDLLVAGITAFSQLERGRPGDVEAAAEHARALTTRLREIPPSQYNSTMLTPFIEALEQVSRAATGQPGEVPVLPPLPGPATASLSMAHAGQLATTAAAVATAITGRDWPALRGCVARIAELGRQFPAEHAMRMLAAGLAGWAELSIARLDLTDRAAAGRAAGWFAEATTLAGGTDHPLWTWCAMAYAESLRRSGDPDRDRTRQLGRSALTAHAWQVMLQSGTDHALDAARRAAGDARTVAGWCLDDRAPEELVAALDAGRGLVLHAATASRQVADQLVAAGHPELAQEWRATGGLGRDLTTGNPLGALAAASEVPDDLRVRVLRALEATPAAQSPLGGPGTATAGEIRQALAGTGADALVYLVPAADHRPGLAVVVPVDGQVHPIELPDLVTGPGSPVRRLAGRAGATRDAGPVPAAGRRPALDELCRWAWTAAMRQVLGHTRRRQQDRPVRLVLVPMGMLALVPWHAASTGHGAERRYAIEDAVISYSVSGRVLCTAARRPHRPASSALIVGDPNGDLRFAGVEARAVHQRFYPTGGYLGRRGTPGSGAGTPAEVLDWVASAGSGPSLLHLACHGVVDPDRPADAHLVLADGDLTVRDLLEASRLAALEIEQVFLAACTTSLASGTYDEAVSLSTAFLAAGAHTVFGSLWPVPDAETSVLMYLVHHLLNVESCAPVDALHRAQRWMLDTGRRPPAGMPLGLASQCDRPQLADPLNWAAFTHAGR